MTVLVLTSEEDVTADMVISHLVRQGTPVLRVDPEHFPGRVDLTARSTVGGEVAGRLTTEHHGVELADIRSIWRRRPGPPGHLATTQKEWVAMESERAFYGVLRALDVPWMNHPDAIARSHYKVWQLRVATSVGFRTPDTLITTVPQDAEKFSTDTGPLIVKSVSGHHPEDPPLTLATCRVPEGANFAGVEAAATCLQQEIDKRADLRLTVVDGEMFPCFIASKDRTLDWRFLPNDECTWSIEQIPEEIRHSALQYMKLAGLAYAAFDFALDADGEFWFLEANANGQFGFVELATGAPISQSIATWLARPPSTGPHLEEA